MSILAPFLQFLLYFTCFQIFCVDVAAVQNVLSIYHQDMWIKILGLSCLLDSYYFLLIFSVISSDFGVLGYLWSQNEVITSWWGSQPTQTDPTIYLRHFRSVWAHWYAVHWHILAALHSHLAQILGFWVTYVELKWCDYVMVEADSPFKLLPSSILDIYKVFKFKHIDMLSINIR